MKRKRNTKVSRKDFQKTLVLCFIWRKYILNDNDFDKNKELLEKAQRIDGDHWLLKVRTPA